MEELEKTEEQRIAEELASDAAFKKANPVKSPQGRGVSVITVPPVNA